MSVTVEGQTRPKMIVFGVPILVLALILFAGWIGGRRSIFARQGI